MKSVLNIKEQVLLKKLACKINKLGQFMLSQGLSGHDVHEFVVRCVFGVDQIVQQRSPKLSKDFSSETQQQTNSQVSEQSGLSLEMSLEKVMFQKISRGIKVERILIGYLQKCCVEEEKLRNYLKSQQVAQSPKEVVFDFEKFKEKLTQTKYRKNKYQPSSTFDQPKISPSLSHLCSIKERIHEAKQRTVVQESQKQLEYMRSFEKSLSESIRKTKMLRSMLEKQLLSEFSPLNVSGGDGDEGRGEIY